MGNTTQKRADDGRWTDGSGWQEMLMEDGRSVRIEHSVHGERVSLDPILPPAPEKEETVE